MVMGVVECGRNDGVESQIEKGKGLKEGILESSLVSYCVISVVRLSGRGGNILIMLGVLGIYLEYVDILSKMRYFKSRSSQFNDRT